MCDKRKSEKNRLERESNLGQTAYLTYVLAPWPASHFILASWNYQLERWRPREQSTGETSASDVASHVFASDVNMMDYNVIAMT